MVLSGASSLIGVCALQMAKALGIHAVGIVTRYVAERLVCRVAFWWRHGGPGGMR